MIYRYLSCLFMFSSAICVYVLLRDVRRRLKVMRNVDGSYDGLSGLLRWLYVPSCCIESYVGKYIGKLGRLNRLLEGSGLNRYYNSERYISFALLLGILAAALFIALLDLPFAMAAAVGFVIGVQISIVIPIVHTKNRKRLTDTSLPDLLDMMSLLVRSGVDVIESIFRSQVVLGRGPLKGDMEKLRNSISAGCCRQQALSDIIASTPSKNLKDVLTFVRNSDRMGSGVSNILADIAIRMRSLKMSHVLKSVSRNAELAILPVVLFIMPSTLLIVFGPLMVKLVTGGVDALVEWG